MLPSRFTNLEPEAEPQVLLEDDEGRNTSRRRIAGDGALNLERAQDPRTSCPVGRTPSGVVDLADTRSNR